MSLDVRKEQLELLKFEKKLAGLAAVLAAGSATAASASDKLGSASEDAYGAIQQALVNLADVTSTAHAALETRVVEEGLKALDLTTRVPKTSVGDTVRSILGLG